MIVVEGLAKRFDARDSRRTVVSDLRFVVPEGKLFTLLGPSGCGKTTTLRMLAGLERPNSGRITIDGKTVFSSDERTFVPANRRPIGMVFQSYAIWPHMSVYDNVAFPLTVGGARPSKDVRDEKTLRALELVGLRDFASRSATTLSGGQQQRVALARALVKEPRVLLLDEPLSNLDAQLRERMREEIREVQQRLGITAVYVTHDQGEALAISDFVLLMDRGTVVESGAPEEIYARPRSEFTATFIGVANGVNGIVRTTGAAGTTIETEQGRITGVDGRDRSVGERVRVLLRPEHFALAHERESSDAWAGTVRFRTYQGDCWDYQIEVNGRELRVRVHNPPSGLTAGDAVYLIPAGSKAVVVSPDADPFGPATSEVSREPLASPRAAVPFASAERR